MQGSTEMTTSAAGVAATIDQAAAGQNAAAGQSTAADRSAAAGQSATADQSAATGQNAAAGQNAAGQSAAAGQSTAADQSAAAGAQAKPKRTLAVTEAAVEAMRAQLAKRGTPESAIRVGLRGGGCSGFSYVIEFDDNPPRSGDLVLEFAEPGKAMVRVFCDKKSIIYLAGSVLDWEKKLMYQGFKFKNPQEASRCGCGHSFTVA